MLSNDINERLLATIDHCNFQEALNCIMKGARATYISPYCGRTAVGAAAMVGDAETLEMLIQSCEDPDMDIFRQRTRRNSSETDTTPEGMDNLEWEDEFNNEHNDSDSTSDAASDDISLYYYYAKTFERTGALFEPEFYDTYSTSSESDGGRTKTQDPHTHDAMLMTPLHYAATIGHEDCVEKLLQHGAPIDVCNHEGCTPLHMGIEDLHITRMLVQYGANLNLKTFEGGLTVLHLAIQQHCPAVAMMLLDTNININETDINDQTPLMYALRFCMDDVARKLVEKGARINLHDCKGDTALLYAVRNNRVGMVKLLLDRGARRVTNHYLLHYCVTRESLELAKLLLDSDDGGDSLYVRNTDGYTPKLLAIVRGLPAMLEFLLEAEEQLRFRQTNAERRNVSLDNELLLAVQQIEDLQKFKCIARLLLAYSPHCRLSLYAGGAPSHNCYVPYCQSPLSRAINLQRYDVARFLICEGANIEQICREHVINNLRATISAAKSVAFGNLMVHAGFRFPYKLLFVRPTHWTAARFGFEKRMKTLCTQPLALQAYARITIRQCILYNLIHSETFQTEYRANKQQSSLQRCIDTLGLPRLLSCYLSDFLDIPSRNC